LSNEVLEIAIEEIREFEVLKSTIKEMDPDLGSDDEDNINIQ
jgi:hypothetical protein